MGDSNSTVGAVRLAILQKSRPDTGPCGCRHRPPTCDRLDAGNRLLLRHRQLVTRLLLPVCRNERHGGYLGEDDAVMNRAAIGLIAAGILIGTIGDRPRSRE